MSARITFVVLALLMCCGISHARDERWNNFAEDTDLKYYLDQKLIISLPDNVYIFWVKSVAKDKDFFKKEYNISNLSYIFTNYELDCAVSSYRIRGTIMFDRNRREINKSLPDSEPAFEPVPPESMLELAQDEICTSEKRNPEAAKRPTAPPAATTPARPTAPEASETPVELETPEASETPETPEVSETPETPETPVVPETPVAPGNRQ